MSLTTLLSSADQTAICKSWKDQNGEKVGGENINPQSYLVWDVPRAILFLLGIYTTITGKTKVQSTEQSIFISHSVAGIAGTMSNASLIVLHCRLWKILLDPSGFLFYPNISIKTLEYEQEIF